MITRRDVMIAAFAVCATMTFVYAADPAKPVMKSSVFEWKDLKVTKNANGSRQGVFDERTATLDQLECHITTIDPGKENHVPHRHPEEELIILKEGTVEALQNETKTIAGPGSIIFEASNDLHGLRNVGDVPATYYVIRFWPPGMKKEAAPKEATK